MTDIWLTPPTGQRRDRGFRGIRPRLEPSSSTPPTKPALTALRPAAERRSPMQQFRAGNVPCRFPGISTPPAPRASGLPYKLRANRAGIEQLFENYGPNKKGWSTPILLGGKRCRAVVDITAWGLPWPYKCPNWSCRKSSASKVE
jgi:hypothetical protein